MSTQSGPARLEGMRDESSCLDGRLRHVCRRRRRPSPDSRPAWGPGASSASDGAGREAKAAAATSDVVASVRLVSEAPDFRSDRMESPEGRGIARRAWDSYASTVTRMSRPAVEPLARKLAIPVAMDLTGFWLLWHLEGGFEGLRGLGMSRASIYRRIKIFRATIGVHPDEYVMPGVTLDIEAYQGGRKRSDKSRK